MASSSTSGREELAAILDIAARQDGPVRLLHPRDPKIRERNPGLFPSTTGKFGELIGELLGTMLEEVLGHPKMVILTKFGLETLLRNTPQGQRNALVKRCSPLYRDDLLEIWSRYAIRGEESNVTESVRAAYGKWFPEKKDQSDLEEFREFLAQEIADSWNSAAADEARSRLAHLLRVLGAEPLGKENENVKFTGLEHTPIEPLFPGDEAIIARQGWIFPKSPTPLLLAKAEVRPAKN
jgi:hypothetical protein